MNINRHYGPESGWKALRILGAEVIPNFIEVYPYASRWKQRASYFYFSIKYAQESSSAVDLALIALNDRSKEVRYRACMLIASALDYRALPAHLKAKEHAIPQTKLDILAAIDSIEHQNYNYFVDRNIQEKFV